MAAPLGESSRTHLEQELRQGFPDPGRPSHGGRFGEFRKTGVARPSRSSIPGSHPHSGRDGGERRATRSPSRRPLGHATQRRRAGDLPLARPLRAGRSRSLIRARNVAAHGLPGRHPTTRDGRPRPRVTGEPVVGGQPWIGVRRRVRDGGRRQGRRRLHRWSRPQEATPPRARRRPPPDAVRSNGYISAPALTLRAETPVQSVGVHSRVDARCPSRPGRRPLWIVAQSAASGRRDGRRGGGTLWSAPSAPSDIGWAPRPHTPRPGRACLGAVCRHAAARVRRSPAIARGRGTSAPVDAARRGDGRLEAGAPSDRRGPPGRGHFERSRRQDAVSTFSSPAGSTLSLRDPAHDTGGRAATRPIAERGDRGPSPTERLASRQA